MSVPNDSTIDRLQLSVFRQASAQFSPELADLIEIDRTLYYHWAIYVGDGEVVDLVGQDDEDFPNGDVAFVRKISLEELGGESGMRVNNKEVPAKEKGVTALDAEEVVKKALSMVGEKVSYNFLTCNVEHYLTEWKYGIGWSDQASVALSAIKGIKELKRSSGSNAHSLLVNTLNAVLNSPGANNMPSSPSLTRSTSLSTGSQTEPFTLMH